MSYSSSNHSASGRSVKFRDLEDGAGDASGSRTSSKMSGIALVRRVRGAPVGRERDTTSSRRGRLGKPAPLKVGVERRRVRRRRTTRRSASWSS